MPGRDTLGRFAKFVAPTVVNGRVYVPTYSNRLAIYGLLAAAGQNTNDVQVTAVANSASLLQSAISPGEVVTIYGARLGPDGMSTVQIDDTGHATNNLAGTQVLFDGVAAPLLYTSSGEVGAVVPFGVSMTPCRSPFPGQRSGFLKISAWCARLPTVVASVIKSDVDLANDRFLGSAFERSRLCALQ